MEHFTKILEILAWPVTTISLAFILKKPIFEILPQLSRLKYGNMEVEFNKKLDKLQVQSDAVKSEASQHIEHDKEEDFYLEQVKKTSPRAAILESWIALENSITSSYKLLHPDKKGKVIALSGILKSLVNQEIISSDTYSIVRELRTLRNKAVHNYSFNVTEAEASKFMHVSREQADVIIGEIWQRVSSC